MAPAGLDAARQLYARDAGGREHRRDRHQPGARTCDAVPAALVPGMAGVSRAAVDHDRIASAIHPPGLRLRVARARRAGIRALDGVAPNVAAAASAARSRVADGEASGSIAPFTIENGRARPRPASYDVREYARYKEFA